MRRLAIVLNILLLSGVVFLCIDAGMVPVPQDGGGFLFFLLLVAAPAVSTLALLPRKSGSKNG